MNDAKYIGMDVHQATISVAVRNSSGNLAIEAILETKAETILQFIRGLRGRKSDAVGTYVGSGDICSQLTRDGRTHDEQLKMACKVKLAIGCR